MRLLFVAFLLIASGCVNLPPLSSTTKELSAYAQTGPQTVARGASFDVTVEINKISEVISCRGNVDVFLPQNFAKTSPAVVLAHGLLRATRHHHDTARHLASWGTPVYVVGHCPGGWSLGGIAAFADLMRATADRTGHDKIIYIGFSAGGATAWRVARGDPRTVGYLGLDPVSRDDPGTRETASSYPQYAMFAPRAACNVQQIGRRLFEGAAQSKVVEIAGSTHCHFEAPSDFYCSALCGEYDDDSVNAALRADILTKTTAFVRWVSGFDATVKDWQ